MFEEKGDFTLFPPEINYFALCLKILERAHEYYCKENVTEIVRTEPNLMYGFINIYSIIINFL